MGRGLSKADLATRTFLLAAVSSLIMDRQSAAEMNQRLHAMILELSMRLDDNFALTNEQKASNVLYRQRHNTDICV